MPAGETPVIILADGTVWSVTTGETSYDGITAQMLIVSDVTELYRRTTELRKQQKTLEKLNERLVKFAVKTFLSSVQNAVKKFLLSLTIALPAIFLCKNCGDIITISII